VKSELSGRSNRVDAVVQQKLRGFGLPLPTAPKPAGNYSAVVRAGNLLFLSGQFPIHNESGAIKGRVGVELTEEEGYIAARLAALNVLAHIQTAIGSFENLERLVRVEGYVASSENWLNTPKVLDGASDLFVAALGERGGHARSAINVPRLPYDFTVELVVSAAIKSRPVQSGTQAPFPFRNQSAVSKS
jgi:enamine deaminase RidA (YjgF/YER057c/UK114 family)